MKVKNEYTENIHFFGFAKIKNTQTDKSPSKIHPFLLYSQQINGMAHKETDTSLFI